LNGLPDQAITSITVTYDPRLYTLLVHRVNCESTNVFSISSKKQR
jgi:hypothetical protein